MGHQLLAQIRFSFASFVLALGLIAALFVTHHLSTAVFVASIGLLAIVGAIILTRFHHTMRGLATLPDPLDPPPEDLLRRRLWVNAFSLATVILFLSFALWETRSRLASPHTMVIVFALFFTTVSISKLRRDHATLKQLQTRRSP